MMEFYMQSTGGALIGTLFLMTTLLSAQPSPPKSFGKHADRVHHRLMENALRLFPRRRWESSLRKQEMMIELKSNELVTLPPPLPETRNSVYSRNWRKSTHALQPIRYFIFAKI